MVITSKNEGSLPIYFRTTHLRYAIIYVLVTFAVLLFLNIYTSRLSQQIFYGNKKSSMIELCHITASEIAGLEVLNNTTMGNAVSDPIATPNTRIIITDHVGNALYDTERSISVAGKIILYPEVVTALSGNDVFTWQYHAGAMQSHAATPIIAYGNMIGCIYMVEYDTNQGALIFSIQQNIFFITLVLEIVVILFSLISSVHYSSRLRRILDSMRTARDGDYSHQVKMRGGDELGLLATEFDSLIGRLQTSERKRTQFVSDASHELKTPLASIKLLSDSILQNNMDLETVREFVGDIGNEAERLNRMSQKLLELSRSDNDEQRECEIIYIAPTVERVTRLLSGIANQNQVSIHTDLTQDSTILIPVDDLYQIIFNLAENGIKYNVPNGNLFITLSKEADNAVIKIRDTGVGIPEESVEHIFERFYRVDKARSRSTGGSGLGLSIVRSMVNRNSGTIHTQSVMGKGTEFTLTFPIFDIEEDNE